MATVPHNRSLSGRWHEMELLVTHIGKDLLGGVLLFTGIMFSLTLVMIPVGVPAALIGVALLMTAWDD